MSAPLAHMSTEPANTRLPQPTQQEGVYTVLEVPGISGFRFRGPSGGCGSRPCRPTGLQRCPHLCSPEAPRAETSKLPLPAQRMPSVFPKDTAVNLRESPILQKQTLSLRVQPEKHPPSARHVLQRSFGPHFQAPDRARSGRGAAHPSREPPASGANRSRTYLSRADRRGSR